MPQLIPQYAFIAGEVSPEFKGRTDLVKYSLGLGLARNWYVGYRGGVYSRAGSRLVGQIIDDDKPTKIVRFRATDDDYLLVLTDLKMRFVQNGGYVLEAQKAITAITAADPARVTSNGHSYTTGDWVYIVDTLGLTEVNGRYFEVGATTTNTFTLILTNGSNFDSTLLDAYTGGGQVSRVYTIATTYAAADLEGLEWEQEFNDITFTHLSYPPRVLTFTSAISWVIADVVFGSSVSAPTNLSLTPASVGTAGVSFSVTAVIDGVESLPSEIVVNELTANYSDATGSMQANWDSIVGANWYFVYRSLILPTGANISRSQELGFIGRALATEFIDNNITPDFTKTPPLNLNPFADGAIEIIEMTNEGTSYAKADTVTMSGGGTGFSGYPIVLDDGRIVAVAIINAGEGYSSPTIAFNTSTGSNAAATVTEGLASGNNPRVYKKFQQRGVYAGTTNFPMTLWGSKPGKVDNFDISSQLNDGDSYSFQVDASVVKPILHLVALKSGLLAFDESAVTQLKAAEGVALSPINALAEPQLYNGIGAAKPLTVGLDVIYVQNISSALNVMAYTEYTNSFTLENLSGLAHHLLGEGKQLIRLEHAEEPDKIIYALREDGRMLSLTYERIEKVSAFAQFETKGHYKDVATLEEGDGISVYTVVKRFIDGVFVKFIERSLPRATALVEDHWCVDCGLEYEHAEPAATLTPDAATGTGIDFTASSGVFVSGDIGKIIYIGGGKCEITAFTSTTVVVCTILRDITNVIPQYTTDKPVPAAAGEWTMAIPITTLTNLFHLEGETVSLLVDGDAFIDKTVVDGTITWDNPATKIRVGLQYLCDGLTLPVSSTQEVLESRRKDILGIGIQLFNTRGLEVGPALDQLEEMKDRTAVDWGDPLDLRSDSSYQSLDSNWDEDGVVAFRQKYPLPATILSFVYDVDEGDE